MTKPDIGVLGAGRVGRRLASGLVDVGCRVMLGSRSPGADRCHHWRDQSGPRACLGTLNEAAAFGDLLVLATVWSGVPDALAQIDPECLEAKTVIDVTNPLVYRAGGCELAVGHTDSAGEWIQRLMETSNIVKAFNTTSVEDMVCPRFPEGRPDMLICGNDPLAKEQVAAICRWLGWNPVDVGDIRASRCLEPLSLLWIRLHGSRHRNVAVRLLWAPEHGAGEITSDRHAGQPSVRPLLQARQA